jgi:hypothetical protein
VSYLYKRGRLQDTPHETYDNRAHNCIRSSINVAFAEGTLNYSTFAAHPIVRGVTRPTATMPREIFGNTMRDESGTADSRCAGFSCPCERLRSKPMWTLAHPAHRPCGYAPDNDGAGSGPRLQLCVVNPSLAKNGANLFRMARVPESSRQSQEAESVTPPPASF